MVIGCVAFAVAAVVVGVDVVVTAALAVAVAETDVADVDIAEVADGCTNPPALNADSSGIGEVTGIVEVAAVAVVVGDGGVAVASVDAANGYDLLEQCTGPGTI